MASHHAYAFGQKAYPMGGSSGLQISPNKFQPRSKGALRGRQKLLVRLIMIGTACLFILVLLSPGSRSMVLPVISLGLLGTKDHIQLETVRYYDLSDVQGTARGWEREERVLLCAPLRDAESHLPMFFSHLRNLTYPHHLIDLAFLVSDSKDRTLDLLSELLEALQADQDPKQPYGEISIIEKDFGQKVNQDVESRHGFAAQAGRRKLMAQARNWLLGSALRPVHSWVYWRDVDVETAPFTILEDLMRHNKDVIVPNVWRPLPDWLGGEQPYDLNSWQESETALALADTLDEDAVIVEGYAEYATWRPHLAYLRDPYGDPDMEMEIDGVGGVSILAKAKVFRSGVHFPAFSFEKHAETEGFGKMAKRMKFSVVGLPHYTVWHLYEPSVDDIRHMEEMEQEREEREKEDKERQERAKKVKEEFSEPNSQWEKDKNELHAMAFKEQEKVKSTQAKETAKAAGKTKQTAKAKESEKAEQALNIEKTERVKEGKSKDPNESKQGKDSVNAKQIKEDMMETEVEEKVVSGEDEDSPVRTTKGEDAIAATKQDADNDGDLEPTAGSNIKTDDKPEGQAPSKSRVQKHED